MDSDNDDSIGDLELSFDDKTTTESNIKHPKPKLSSFYASQSHKSHNNILQWFKKKINLSYYFHFDTKKK